MVRTPAMVAALRRQSRTSFSWRWASNCLAPAFTRSRSASSSTGSGLVRRSKIANSSSVMSSTTVRRSSALRSWDRAIRRRRYSSMLRLPAL